MNYLDGHFAIPDVHDDDADDNAFFTLCLNFFITSCCSSSSATIGAALSTTWQKDFFPSYWKNVLFFSLNQLFCNGDVG